MEVNKLMGIFFQFDKFEYILFYLVTAIWILEFFIFPSTYKQKDKSETKSFLKILAVILLSHGLTILLTYLDLFRIAGQFGYVLMIIALLTYPFGLLLRYVSIIYLGKHFTRNVEVSKTQTLVSTGPYKYLKHPLYLGLFFLTISVPLFFGNYLMVIVSSVMMFLILNHRMNIEEKLMTEAIGQTYTKWQKKRYRFIPYIY